MAKCPHTSISICDRCWERMNKYYRFFRKHQFLFTGKEPEMGMIKRELEHVVELIGCEFPEEYFLEPTKFVLSDNTYGWVNVEAMSPVDAAMYGFMEMTGSPPSQVDDQVAQPLLKSLYGQAETIILRKQVTDFLWQLGLTIDDAIKSAVEERTTPVLREVMNILRTGKTHDTQIAGKLRTAIEEELSERTKHSNG